MTVLEGIQKEAEEDCRVLYAEGSHMYKDVMENLAWNDDRISEAVITAKHSDVTVVVLGLDETMEALAAYYQREEEILDAVKSAVTYPVAMLGMLLVIVAVLFIKVMPVFEQVYMQLGQEMTGVARQLLNIEYWRLDEAVSNCSGSFGSGDLDHSIFRYFL